MELPEKIKKFIPLVLTYSGTSMYPKLRESDMLRIYTGSKYLPSKGDIILFEHPDNKNPIVHRIIEIEEDRIYTKGDNSHEPDPWVLTQADIKGTVIQIWRNRKTIHILKDKGLQRKKNIHQLLLNIIWPIYLYLKPIYKSATLNGIFYNLLPYRLKPRPVIFTSNNNAILYLIFNKINVARYDRSQKKWFIKPPFRFMISRECMDKARLDFEKYLLDRQNSGYISSDCSDNIKHPVTVI